MADGPPVPELESGCPKVQPLPARPGQATTNLNCHCPRWCGNGTGSEVARRLAADLMLTDGSDMPGRWLQKLSVAANLLPKIRVKSSI